MVAADETMRTCCGVLWGFGHKGGDMGMNVHETARRADASTRIVVHVKLVRVLKGANEWLPATM
eukprot:scaffold239988_cov26-Tisochrysis_lutea.AAC.3